MKKLVSATNKSNQQVNPVILELVQMGNGIGGTRVSGKTREELERSFDQAMSAAKERFNLDAATT